MEEAWTHDNGDPGDAIPTDPDQLQAGSLSGGRLGVVVDTGALTSLQGQYVYERFHSSGEPYDFPSELLESADIHKIRGMGAEKWITCDKYAIHQLAFRDWFGVAHYEKYCPHIVPGSGSRWSSMMGNTELGKKDAVIVCREGQQFLALPGPGGFRAQFSPGTKIIPLERTSSGHLAFECGDHEALQRRPPSSRDFRQSGHVRSDAEEREDWADAITVDYTEGDFAIDFLNGCHSCKMILDINPEPDSGCDLRTERTRFSWEIPDGRYEPDWTGYQRVVHARCQAHEDQFIVQARRQAREEQFYAREEEQHQARLLEEPPEGEPPVNQPQRDQSDAPNRETLPGPPAINCDVCLQPIRINEQFYALEDANFAGNRHKQFHVHCVHKICPGFEPLLVRRVRLNEDGTVQPTERFGDPISNETMEEVWLMMEQIEVRHYQNMFAQQDSDGDSSEADDNIADGGSWCKFRCLIGLVICFLTAYITRINWSR